jgi:hypothetical protein
MSGTATILMEVSFDIAYLIAVWALVGIMLCRFGQLNSANRTLAKYY